MVLPLKKGNNSKIEFKFCVIKPKNHSMIQEEFGDHLYHNLLISMDYERSNSKNIHQEGLAPHFLRDF